MHPRIRQIVASWRERADNSPAPFLKISTEELDLVLRWAATADQRDVRARQIGREEVISYLATRMPQRNTKRDWMPACCSATVWQMIGEVRRKPI